LKEDGMTSKEFRELGMDRPIARRDFLNGVALAIAGTSAALETAGNAQAQAPTSPPADPQAATYPPVRDGLRGNYPAAVDIFDPIRKGQYAQFPVPDAEIQEEYDLVIVGAGMSGLSAAHFWRSGLGPRERILILDNHDDFGGHAKRNEFHHNGRTYIGVGGTLGIATTYPYSYGAKALIKELGVEVDRGREFNNRDLEAKYHLAAGTFFNREMFKVECLIPGNIRQPGFVAKMPISEEARKDLTRLLGKNPDYMAGMSEEEKKAKLAKISYQDFLLNYARVSREVLVFAGGGSRNSKKVDSTAALEQAQRGAIGTNGLGLKFEEEKFNEGSYALHFPDGNASIGRLLVSRLIPAVAGGQRLDMNNVVQAQFDYSKLDEADSKMRIRLGSPVVRVMNEGSPEHPRSVKLAYIKDGKLRGVRAKNCILACYNALIPSLMPEIPQTQKDALAYPAKVPLNYTNVLIRKWTAFQKLGVSRISFPGMWFSSANLDAASTFGGYQGVTTPDEPMIVHMTCTPGKPGLPRKEQNRAGAAEMLAMSFQDFEFKIRDQLARALGPGGFDPKEDILAITTNRWPYGYAYTYDVLNDPDVPPEQRPHVIGRQRFGRVTIANSDAGAAAFTNEAFDQANRAVQELFVLDGLT
jgi:spermidine dehydrogenase